MSVLKKISESSMFSMKTPRFWHQNGLMAQLFMPLSVVYFLIKRIKFKKITPHKFNIKIICIGNLVVGGAGKTPTAIAIREVLQKNYPADKIAFITTGFKGKISGPVKIDLSIHNFKDVGDEPILLANYGDVIMCKNRFEAIKFAEDSGYNIAILDDGLHDNRFIKDKSFAVIDGKYGFGNGLLIPAGPLRDRIDYATNKADEIIIIGEDEKKSVSMVKYKTKINYQPIEAKILSVSEVDKSAKYIAFAGIGRPSKFYDTLNEIGLNVIETVDFPDHHSYLQEDIEHLQELAKSASAQIITTEKDYIKLPQDFKNKISCLKIKVVFDDSKISL